MTTAIDGIDHGVFIVRDLDAAAAAAYARLGFTVTGLGRHTGLGTGNRLVMLGDDYIELLGVLEPNEYNEPFRAHLERREGLWMLALSSPDATAAAARFRAAGIAADEPLHFTRPGGKRPTPRARPPSASPAWMGRRRPTPSCSWCSISRPGWSGTRPGRATRTAPSASATSPSPPPTPRRRRRPTTASCSAPASYTAGGDDATLATGRQPIHFVTPPRPWSAVSGPRRRGRRRPARPARPCPSASPTPPGRAAALAANGVPHEVAAGDAVRVAPAPRLRRDPGIPPPADPRPRYGKGIRHEGRVFRGARRPLEAPLWRRPGPRGRARLGQAQGGRDLSSTGSISPPVAACPAFASGCR